MRLIEEPVHVGQLDAVVVEQNELQFNSMNESRNAVSQSGCLE